MRKSHNGPSGAKIVGFPPRPGESADHAAKPGSYFDLAIAYIRDHGGKGFVIERDKGDQRQQWRAWMAYFAWLDGQEIPRGHKAATFGKFAKISTPTAWPLEFDASAPPSPVPDAQPPMISIERRRELAAMLRASVHVGNQKPRPIGLEPPRSPAEAETARRHHEARLEELRETYRATPTTLCAALRGRYASADPGKEIDEIEF